MCGVYQARQVLQACEKQGRNGVTIDYDARNPFQVDSRNLTPIYRGSPTTRCPYCSATFSPAAKGSLCDVCGISEVGVETLGLVVAKPGKQRPGRS